MPGTKVVCFKCEKNVNANGSHWRADRRNCVEDFYSAGSHRSLCLAKQSGARPMPEVVAAWKQLFPLSTESIAYVYMKWSEAKRKYYIGRSVAGSCRIAKHTYDASHANDNVKIYVIASQLSDDSSAALESCLISLYDLHYKPEPLISNSQYEHKFLLPACASYSQLRQLAANLVISVYASIKAKSLVPLTDSEVPGKRLIKRAKRRSEDNLDPVEKRLRMQLDETEKLLQIEQDKVKELESKVKAMSALINC